MIDIEALKPHIVEKLKPLKPKKIILFGSYAYGIPTEESDLDLCIITEKDTLSVFSGIATLNFFVSVRPELVEG